MLGGFYEFTLYEAFGAMAMILAMIAVGALVASILTLPIFLLALGAVNAWFWSADSAAEGGGRAKRLLAGLAYRLFPIASVLSTFFALAYMGALDAGKNPLRDKSSLQSLSREKLDQTARGIAQAVVPPPAPAAKKTDTEAVSGELAQLLQDETPEEDPVKKPAQALNSLLLFSLMLIGPFPTLMMLGSLIVGRQGIVLMLRGLGRNLLRTSLTYLATFVLVTVVVAVWAVLGFLNAVVESKEENLKVIVTEKHQIPSQMPPAHLGTIEGILEKLPEEMKPKKGGQDIMTWAFVGGSLEADPAKRTFENSLFFFCMEPSKFMSMMDGLDDLTSEQRRLLDKATAIMDRNPRAVAIGREKLKQIKKRVGDTIKLTSLNYTGLVFDLVILAELPEGRYDQSAVMNRRYLDQLIDDYAGRNGSAHPLAAKSMNLIWLRLPTKKAFETFAERVTGGGQFAPAVKVEMASSAIATFLEPYKDIFWFLRWVLAPALLVTMTVVISNAISISVRERRTEMAVLKVLGFRPWMVMGLVLGEALIVGGLSGFMAALTAYAGINALGGISLPIGFFGKFFIPPAALWWGPVIGVGTALIGTLVPAWSARSIKVSEVFSRVA
jgi:putative ABC transport system permease protein